MYISDNKKRDEYGFLHHSEVDMRNYLNRCIFFFPEDCELKPITCYVNPPVIGTKISLHNLAIKVESSEYDYGDWYDWTVNDVILRIDVSNTTDGVKRCMMGIPTNVAIYEVYLTGGKRYSYLHLDKP